MLNCKFKIIYLSFHGIFAFLKSKPETNKFSYFNSYDELIPSASILLVTEYHQNNSTTKLKIIVKRLIRIAPSGLLMACEQVHSCALALVALPSATVSGPYHTSEPLAR